MKHQKMEDDDAGIEEEIASQLSHIHISEKEFQNDGDDDFFDPAEEDTETLDDVLLGSMQDYVNKIQQQSNQLEEELDECTHLLTQSDIVSARPFTRYDELESFAVEEGVDVETLKNQVLSKLEEEDQKEMEWMQSTQNSDTELSGQATFITAQTEPIGVEADKTEDENVGEEKNENQSGANLAVIEVTEADRLEKEFQDKLVQIEKKCKEHSEVRQKALQERKHYLEIREKKNEERRQKRKEEIQAEEDRVRNEKLLNDAKFRKEAIILEHQMEQALQEYKVEIDVLSNQVKIEEEKFIETQQAEEERKGKMRNEAAMKIQSLFRGYRERKMLGSKVNDVREQVRRKLVEKRIAEVEEKIQEKKKEEKRVEDEKKRVEEELLRKKEEEKRLKEEEKLKKKEEERIKKEEEKKKKEEEKRRREEEKKRKEEEERLRKEEEKRRKEEEKRRKEEEKRKKEEERKRKEAEAKRMKEEEMQRKEEEKKQKELEEKLRIEEELRKKQEEERKQELEKQRQEEEALKKAKEEQEELERQKKEKLRQEEQAKIAAEEAEKCRIENEKQRYEEAKNCQAPMNHAEEIRKRVEEKREALHSRGCVVNGKDVTIDQWGDFMPETLEKRRLQWMKNCLPWSKTAGELKTRSSSGKPPRRPFSAKELQELDPRSVLSVAGVSSLQDVTTVSLHDLPGRNNLKIFKQTSNLKYLYLHKCGLVCIDDLHGCKSLQYASFIDNMVENVNLTGLSHLTCLDLSHNNLTSIHGLHGCHNLQYLNLNSNKITRIGGLETLKRLHTLLLANNQLISCKGIAQTPTVQTLDLSNNHLSSTCDLESLGLLQELNVSCNNLMQVPLLSNNVLLHTLNLSENNISSLSPLSMSWLPLLHSLNLARNSLLCVDNLNACISLQTLNIADNQISDAVDVINGLAQSRSLKHLIVSGCPLAEDAGHRDRIAAQLEHLKTLDNKKLSREESILNLTHYEKMCGHQLKASAALQQEFNTLLKASKSLGETCKVHRKFYQVSQQMVVEQRICHEYGDIVPAAPATPRLKSAHTPRPPDAPAPSQSLQMKNKFDMAIQGADQRTSFSETPRERKVARVLPQQQEISEVNPNTHDEQVKSFGSEHHKAATLIQAVWRGYFWRKRLHYALAYAREMDEEEPDDGLMEFGEVDLDAFNFDEDDFEKAWVAPPTPQLPKSHPVIAPTAPSLPMDPSPHLDPMQAWRATPPSLASSKPPLPPLSRMSDTSADINTHRSGLSKKGEKITEEWGFKDTKTTELMLARAKKLKYNALKKKKLSQLDPHQRLALMRKLEENARLRPVVPPGRGGGLPRKEYFQAKERENSNNIRQTQHESKSKEHRTFEWVHTQVGDHGFNQQTKLPHYDPALLSGKRNLFSGSPASMDLQSVDSTSQVSGDVYLKPRRMSFQEPTRPERLPPIKATSAPSSNKGEKMSRRNAPVRESVGWGGGRRGNRRK